MSNQKTIKQIYSDALYWAISPMSKGKPYHITRVEESVLRKLIHYDKTNSRIDYSNELIGIHTFLDVTTTEKVIPSLNKKGYLKTITFQINDGTGKITSRRIININWDFIAGILAEVPVTSIKEEENNQLPLTDSPNKSIHEASGSVAIAPTLDSPQAPNLLPTSEITVNTEKVSLANSVPSFNVKEYLTPTRLKVADEYIQKGKISLEKFKISDLHKMSQDELNAFFKFKKGTWVYYNSELDGFDYWENSNGIILNSDRGDVYLTLSIVDNQGTQTDSFQILWLDFLGYIEKKKINFGKVTHDNYITLGQFKKEPLKMYK